MKDYESKLDWEKIKALSHGTDLCSASANIALAFRMGVKTGLDFGESIKEKDIEKISSFSSKSIDIYASYALYLKNKHDKDYKNPQNLEAIYAIKQICNQDLYIPINQKRSSLVTSYCIFTYPKDLYEN